ncbi:MAG: DUF1638 domain-containing protein, partial [bacterium]
GDENGRYVMEMEQAWMSNYRCAAFVDWGFECSEKHRRFTRQCARNLQWEFDELEGDPGLLTRMLSGQWSEEEFLVVSPGQTLEATVDDQVIREVPHTTDT